MTDLIARWERYRSDTKYAPNDLIDDTISALAAHAERDAEIERLKASVRDRAASECVQYERAEVAEARVKELEQLATPAVVEGFFGLNNRAMRAEKERDALRARLEALVVAKPLGYLVIWKNGDRPELCELPPTHEPWFDKALPLIERPKEKEDGDV